MSVSVAVEQSDAESAEIDVERWAGVVRSTLLAEGVEDGHVDLFFVSRDEIAELNLEHMGKSGPTDVLSFPLDDGGLEVDPFSQIDDAVTHLGDIVISLEVAAEQAPSHAGSLESELSLLAIHGVLHLLGLDHVEQDEAIEMRSREAIHLAKLGFDHPGTQS